MGLVACSNQSAALSAEDTVGSLFADNAQKNITLFPENENLKNTNFVSSGK